MTNLTTIKGRTIEAGQKVKVYFNLHKMVFSVQDAKTGLVIGHTPVINLEGCEFKVSEAGRQRVLREKKKNVHAFVTGYYVNDQAGQEEQKANYNPYKYKTFVDLQEQALQKAKSVTCINKQIKYTA
ncbi:hypothetical protein QFZ31_006692 [Neobacillus niacini]|uniref:hypothetical protein n=1 Tax=Neobacillus driksii TaxID=3035913 RepID=UPI002787BD84|nr:hypothetical protein [Neobacillus niacini]MDQ0976640.1 hypothetical protein [Neobacillus niacini]